MIAVGLKKGPSTVFPRKGSNGANGSHDTVVVRVDDLMTAPYQLPREPSAHSWAKKMVPDYDPSRIGTPEASYRDDSWFIVDGLGRAFLLSMVGEEEVRVKPHYGLKYEEEAALYVALNKDKRKHTPYQEFYGDYEAGNEKVVAIVDLSEEFGYNILKEGPGRDKIRCYNELRKIVNSEGGIELLRKVYEVIEPWKGFEKNTQGEILRAVAHFIIEHGHDHKVITELKKRLRTITPETVKRLAYGKRVGNAGSTAYMATYEVLKDEYNHRRRSGKI